MGTALYLRYIRLETLMYHISGLCSVSEAMLDIGDGEVNVSAILNQFMVGYDKRVRPNYGGIPVTVGVSLYILSIGDLSEKYMDFTFDMYFRQFWHDPRLSFTQREGELEKLVVGAEYIRVKVLKMIPLVGQLFRSFIIFCTVRSKFSLPLFLELRCWSVLVFMVRINFKSFHFCVRRYEDNLQKSKG